MIKERESLNRNKRKKTATTKHPLSGVRRKGASHPPLIDGANQGIYLIRGDPVYGPCLEADDTRGEDANGFEYYLINYFDYYLINY